MTVNLLTINNLSVLRRYPSGTWLCEEHQGVGIGRIANPRHIEGVG